MKKITLTLLAFFVTCCLWQVNAQTTECGNAPELIPAGAALPTPSSGPMNPSIASVSEAGLVGTHWDLDNITVDVEHTWASDIDMTLTSPGGTTVSVMVGRGGSDGLDTPATIVFTDASANDVTSWSGGAPAADYQAEGGLFNTVFAGESVSGDWTLNITDLVGGDIGQLNSYCITFTQIIIPVNECGNAPELIPAGAALPTPSSGPMNPSIASVSDSGVIGTNATLNNITVDVEHTWASDIDMTLTSPGGTTVTVMVGRGGSDGLDTPATIVFTDGSGNDVTTWSGGAPAADYQPEGGLFNTVFAGEDINGDWTLNITDLVGGDIGQLNSYCIDFSTTAPLGDPPMMTCPLDVTTTASAGVCGAVVAFPPPLVTDPDGDLDTVVQTMGLPSGSEFPVGTTTVEFTATDLAGNVSTCSFTVTVTDDEAPNAVCMDITVQLDANGEYVLVPSEIDGGSTDNCAIASLEVGTSSGLAPGLYTLSPFVAGVGTEIGYYDYDPATDALSVNTYPYGTTIGGTQTYSFAHNADTGMTYVLGDDAPGSGVRALWEYDLAAGTLGALLGSVVSSGGATNPNAMTFAPDGTMYVSYGGGTIETFDIGTMTSTAFTTAPNFLGGVGLAYDYDTGSVLYSTSGGGGGDGTVEVYSIDGAGVGTLALSFGTGTGLPNGCFGTAQAMAYVGGGKIIASSTWGCDIIYTMDLGSGAVTSLASPTGTDSRIKAHFYIPPSITGAPDLLLTCADVGTNTITLLVTDDSGNQSTCEAMVTVEDVTAPEVFCIGEPAVFSYLQEFESSSIPMNWTSNVITGTDDWAFGSGDLPTGDDFPTNAAIFDDDAAGNGTVNELELLSPVFDLDGAIIANLSYEVAFQEFGDQEFSIEVWDGAAWQQLELIEDNLDPDIQSRSFDVLAYANADFQVRYHYDDLGGWGWHAAIDNFQLDYEFPPSAPLQVELDANGNASIPVSDLLDMVNEACGWTATVPDGSIGACASEISNASNAFENGYFSDPGSGFLVANDIVVPADEDFNLQQVVMNLFHDVGATIASADFTYYDDAGGQPGAVIGSEAGVVPSAQTVVGNNFGFDVSETTFDITPFLFAGQAGVQTNYWVSVSVSSTSGGITAWEVSSASGAGDFDCLNTADGGATWGNPVPGNDGVYIFRGNCEPGATDTLDLDCSNLGLNQYEVTVTDASGNTATCIGTVEVLDVTDPILVCQDVTIEIGPDGTTEIDPEDLLANAPSTFEAMVIGSDNQSGTEGFTDFTVDVTADVTVSFDWDYTLNDTPGFDSFGYLVNGTYTQLTDPAQGNQSGSASVSLVAGDVFGFRSQTDDNIFGNNETLVTNFMPGFDGQFDPANWTLTLTNSDGDAFFVEIPGGPLSFDACGITVLATDLTEVTCADVGTTITATVFASDASGNIASCTSQVTVVDAMGPELTCPDDQTVDPGPGNLFYEIPDYFATGEATATDNCTDPVTITSQDPAAGTLVPDGTYTITLTAEDEYGNVSTCTFELTVESVLGLEDTVLDNAISIYPNPAESVVTLANTANILLDQAAIYDTNGRHIQTIDLSDMQQEKAIDVSTLATGVYMVLITSEDASTVKRLVKE
ncbi:HYR domain-containing protein [Aureisphaera galaxeae]|uniref:HYR domain-containing protein n=1 Tax=Aureisphaera galaxeae TaxID=1538023 RepID=UPI00235087F8|nr:HYR domain-containing protein [Aureisphaera galaxeae]MDC8005471.1 HYR domain-containing protein [Aureisphaera galaxeae]